MPHAEVDGVTLHYRIDGAPDRPWLVLSNSLGTTLDMWAPQMATLTNTHRVLRYDKRGHGDSAVGRLPPSFARLSRDLVGLMDHVGIARADFMGLSMGGMTGMWLATHARERFRRFVLANTAARMPSPAMWNARIDAVLSKGMEPMMPAIVERWCTKAFREQQPGQVRDIARMILATAPKGYAHCCAAVRDMDQRESIRAITSPVLVIAGSADPATPAAQGEAIRASIPGAAIEILEAAHLSNIEQPEAFSAAVTRFLNA